MAGEEVRDRIILEGMEFFGRHGAFEAERAVGVRIRVDAELRLDLSQAGRSDELEDTVDYATCVREVRRVVEDRQFRLLEALAESIATTLLAHPRAESVRVRVAKQPPVPETMREFAVAIERTREE